MTILDVISYDPDSYLCKCVVMVFDERVRDNVYSGHTEVKIVSSSLLDSMKIEYRFRQYETLIY